MKTILHSLLAISVFALPACVPDKNAAPSRSRVAGQPPSAVVGDNAVIPKGLIPNQTPAVKVALLLPLSGDSSAVGNAMLDAATMALYDNYLAVPSNRIHSQIVLMPRDTGNTPADAVVATKQALEQKATFIIGPLFSQSVTAIAPLAQEKNISMLTFSNNKAVAGNGVYLFGFLPEQQVSRLADYAFLHKLQRVAVLAPNDSYGEKINETLGEIYRNKGGIVSPTEFYAPSPANIDAAISRLVNTYNNASEERRFQAIFIGDGGYQLKNIIQSLKKTNLDLSKIKLLGTGLWDDPEIAKIPEMQGAWFASSPPNAYHDFERRFMTVYGYKPVRLASMAYDAVTLAVAVSMPSPATSISTAALIDPSGFNSPANGLFRLRADGTIERRLAVMEVTPTGFKIIDPAPLGFEQRKFTGKPAPEAPPAAPQSTGSAPAAPSE